ncbi:hypothetical protein PHYSODRAFT_515946 [Phytophthora sojae]|uniref:Uncharacterized protein n=1 Tax=Phytophthora sojae (strain P6497) TaxID=1094619 RepID=G4ZWC7_PHYSP|nr:hypothetical protein PHYSODRAFT_515946 [Phytophthora sojae]EGZ11654.1 hypothetical protein PHYSODRAFT_515946 [Phytophthora sojae]|eukprot:XP_009531987.1 hypothetical protein PHYSODRAFT_515946 [Phytophthora sojae]
MAGPAPTDQQVADFVKTYRRDRPKYSMKPMIELCDAHLYDDKVILCDSEGDARPGAARSNGSKVYRLRVGMTCVRLVRDYASVLYLYLYIIFVEYMLILIIK